MCILQIDVKYAERRAAAIDAKKAKRQGATAERPKKKMKVCIIYKYKMLELLN